MKNFRILRIYASCPYENVFIKFYQDRNLQASTYDQAMDEFCNNGYIIPGQWCASMKKLGNEALDVVPDCFLLQKKWAEENGVAISSENLQWKTELLFKQIEIIKPDVIYFYAGGWMLLSDDLRRQLKSKFPFIKVITGLWGDALPPTENYSKFRDVDLLFIAYEYILKEVRSQGIPAVLNGNCFDPYFAKILADDENSKAHHDFIFAGSSGYSSPTHINRYLGLLRLLENTELKIWCYEPTIRKAMQVKDFIRDSLTKTLARLPKGWLNQLQQTFSKPSSFTNQIDKFIDVILGTHYENRLLRILNESIKSPSERYGVYKWDVSLKPIKKLFPDRCFPSKFGLEYFKLLRDSKVVFNCHINEALHAGNIRMFEVTGMGSCLLTDNPREARHLFKLDEEIVGYSSFDEAIEKVKYLLLNEDKRKAIAAKGRERTLRDHTVMNRCQVIHDALQKF